MIGMEPADEETLRFYGNNAPAYAEREITSRQIRLGRFLALLSPGASILELGCGARGDSAEMLARGFDLSATVGCRASVGAACPGLCRPDHRRLAATGGRGFAPSRPPGRHAAVPRPRRGRSL